MVNGSTLEMHQPAAQHHIRVSSKRVQIFVRGVRNVLLANHYSSQVESLLPRLLEWPQPLATT
jgi:hypothetical protein